MIKLTSFSIEKLAHIRQYSLGYIVQYLKVNYFLFSCYFPVFKQLNNYSMKQLSTNTASFGIFSLYWFFFFIPRWHCSFQNWELPPETWPSFPNKFVAKDKPCNVIEWQEKDPRTRQTAFRTHFCVLLAILIIATNVRLFYLKQKS